jgi:hypothetical protein
MDLSTNCGTVTLAENSNQMIKEFTNAHLNSQGGPELTRNHITYFHKTLCNWAYNVPLKFSWVLVIDAVSKNFLLNSIKDIERGYYEDTGWKISKSVDATFSENVQDTVGCIFAQGVTIPGETIKTEHTVIEGSNRGFINTPIIAGRTDFVDLEVVFMETNRSFIDGFLRPWSIVVSHRGLLAYPNNQSIKANITVHKLARIGTDQNSKIRKTFVFENCAPISIDNDSIAYQADTEFPKVKVKFAYSRYYIKDDLDNNVDYKNNSQFDNNGGITYDSVNKENLFDNVKSKNNLNQTMIDNKQLMA